MSQLLEIEHLAVDVHDGRAIRRVVHDVCLTVGVGEAVGLIGESGSGKSLTTKAIARLLPNAKVTADVFRCAGKDVLDLRLAALRKYRQHDIALVFQDPKAHINPVHTLGDFLTEGMRLLDGRSTADAFEQAKRLLTDVGIADCERVLRQYPHQVSGGMLQRVMIASALAGKPKLVLADEPTTALDVVRQAEIVGMLKQLRKEHKIGLLFVTHDLELAATVCDRVAVMYAGSIVECRHAATIHQARHPYTRALLAARPDITRRLPRLNSISGEPISGMDVPTGCAFAERCELVEDKCRTEPQRLVELTDGQVRCRRNDREAG